MAIQLALFPSASSFSRQLATCPILGIQAGILQSISNDLGTSPARPAGVASLMHQALKSLVLAGQVVQVGLRGTHMLGLISMRSPPEGCKTIRVEILEGSAFLMINR